MDIWDIWIKFLVLTIFIVANLNTIVLLDYSNPIFGQFVYDWENIFNI
jgi:hypothetical protein